MTYSVWLSCTKFTCEITVQDHIVVQACPLLRKFIGQPVQNLRRWAAKWPPVNEAVLRDITITDAMGRAAQAERSHQ